MLTLWDSCANIDVCNPTRTAMIFLSKNTRRNSPFPVPMPTTILVIHSDPAKKMLVRAAPCKCACVEGVGCLSIKPDVKNCACMQFTRRPVYEISVNGLLMPRKSGSGFRECNDACACNAPAMTCYNTVLQKGITLPLEVFRTKGKGWYEASRLVVNRSRWLHTSTHAHT